MYSEAPAGEVVLEDFERFAIARLRGNGTHTFPEPSPYIHCSPVSR